MKTNIEVLLADKKQIENQSFDQFVALLANLVAAYLGKTRLITIPKPKFDEKRWLRRQLRMEELRMMDQEMTAQLLGTSDFIQVE